MAHLETIAGLGKGPMVWDGLSVSSETSLNSLFHN